MADSQNIPSSSDVFSFLRKGLRAALAGLLAVTATYLGGCALALSLYGAVFPPLTGVQLQRQIEAWNDGTSSERRYDPVPLQEMARSLPRAAVAAEDSRFFEHHGIDWAMVHDVIDDYQSGNDLRGASTITQQLVKNLFLTTHRSYLRKALEVPLVFLAEGILSKKRILELYLNVVEWGPGVYGAAEASAYHYGQSAAALTAAQSAGLAACLPNPLVRRPQTMGWYQRIILRRMENLGPLPLPRTRPAP
ncbi:MAG: monofunctional biosynthetic peptidoglycan transglycosylase [Salinivenus sp.]